jgi:hypothetical protein
LSLIAEQDIRNIEKPATAGDDCSDSNDAINNTFAIARPLATAGLMQQHGCCNSRTPTTSRSLQQENDCSDKNATHASARLLQQQGTCSSKKLATAEIPITQVNISNSNDNRKSEKTANVILSITK